MRLAQRFALGFGTVDLGPRANHAVQLHKVCWGLNRSNSEKHLIVLILAPISKMRPRLWPTQLRKLTLWEPALFFGKLNLLLLLYADQELIQKAFLPDQCYFKVSKTNSAGPLKSSVHDSYVWNINGWTNPCWNSLGSTGQQCRSYSHFSTAQPTTQEHWAPIGDCAASPSGWCDSWPHSAVWPSGWIRFFVLFKSLVWLKRVFIRAIYQYRYHIYWTPFAIDFNDHQSFRHDRQSMALRDTSACPARAVDSSLVSPAGGSAASCWGDTSLPSDSGGGSFEEICSVSNLVPIDGSTSTGSTLGCVLLLAGVAMVLVSCDWDSNVFVGSWLSSLAIH